MPTLYLCCAKSLNTQLEELSKAGKKGKIAMLRYLEILEAIRTDGLSGDFLMGKRTKRGEARIAKCVKYDLGNGCRLITIRWRDHLFIPFAGSHDKADLWLEHNRLDDIHKKKRLFTREKIVYDAHGDTAAVKVSSLASYDEYEKNLLSRIDEKTLRQVFPGIAVKTGKAADASTRR